MKLTLTAFFGPVHRIQIETFAVYDKLWRKSSELWHCRCSFTSCAHGTLYHKTSELTTQMLCKLSMSFCNFFGTYFSAIQNTNQPFKMRCVFFYLISRKFNVRTHSMLIYKYNHGFFFLSVCCSPVRICLLLLLILFLLSSLLSFDISKQRKNPNLEYESRICRRSMCCICVVQ